MIPFHLAIPVDDLEKTRQFYRDLLLCRVGREADTWIDFDFFGHQLSVHLRPNAARPKDTSDVDGKKVPVQHFGAVLPWDDFHNLADKLKKTGISFIIEPYIRFKDQAGEQATMFFLDPSGNAIEFKSFQNIDNLFATGMRAT